MNTTDLVKALEGEKKPVPYRGSDLIAYKETETWNAAIDRAIEIVENHGKK